MTTKWTAQKLRTAFLEYFQKNGHTIVESSSVLPHNDPTLLFVNSGMVQFKSMFLNQPCQFTGLKRAASIQRCIRAGGKHNDLEDVGFDTYHHTFFEMMGNWSFGDYGKEHAIDLAFRFLTEELRLDSSRMYVSYYVPENDGVAGLHADQETRTIWRKYLPETRILPFTAENFWEMGDTGPCGPCTEIHYDLTGTHGPEHVNTDDPACIEIWNLVFMQFYRDEQGVLSPLDALSVDTGMGMERVLGILNGTTNYGTDLFMPLFEMTGLSYDGVVLSEGEDRSMKGTAGVQQNADRITNGKDGDFSDVQRNADRIKNGKDGDFSDVQRNADRITNDKDDNYPTTRESDNSSSRSDHPKQSTNNFSDSVAQRIIADHARTIAVCLFYGVEFSSEGAGYVLRRITRRMIRVLHSKNVHDLPALVHKAAQILGTPLTDQQMAQLAHEHALFKKTLAQGVKYFNQFGTITAKEMFILKDTYGFPFDLTAQMCREKGIVVDRDELRRLVEQGVRRSKARKGARIGVKRAWAVEHARTAEFLQRDYAHFESTALFAFDEDAIVPLDELRERMKIGLVADRTCFYSEKGGQVGDTGVISFLDEHGRVVRTMSVCDTYKSGEYVVHYGVINGKAGGDCFEGDCFEGEGGCCKGEGDCCKGENDCCEEPKDGRDEGSVAKDGRGNNVKSDGKDLKKVNGSAGNDRHSKTINEQDGLRDKERDKEVKEGKESKDKEGNDTARAEKNAQALKLDMMVDLERRSKIRCNHTATHLLNHVLRTKYGSVQRGSLVADDRLRFDYTMDRKLENAEIKEIEDEVNEMIRKNAEVTVYERRYEEIRDSVVHLPDECYPEVVRIVDAGGARELCGGLHVRMLAHIRCFKIVSEGAISANTRRIIACTGERALECVSNALKIDGYVPGTCNDWEDNLGVLDRMRLLTIKQQKIKESTKMRKSRIRTYSTCTDNVVFADLAGDKKSVLKDLTAIFHNVSKKNAGVIVLARFDGVYPFVCGDVAANAEYVKRWGALHVVRVHGKLCGEIPRLDEKAFVDGFR
ncbi:Alanyl-tRNA synthetase [Trachipleistophora hominis]|uniref:Alanine--tRNA ligase n=1 Tax=Trachipleistophora hominis TaxID=72359 RepID=L7JYN6_TRAHO|nr:Alanyl-tRNA synthetase [Trachipleistophora hominis]